MERRTKTTQRWTEALTRAAALAGMNAALPVDDLGRTGRPARRGRALVAVLAPAVALGMCAPAFGQAAPGPTTGSTAQASQPLVVQTAQGGVRGTAAPGGLRTYQGIPYAAPPVGALRWQPPQPAASWRGTRAATRPGNECVQSAVFWRPGSAASRTEDCLYLNVWTPAKVEPRRPVLVWFHGGGWVNGAGTDVAPSRLTAAGNVVVTVNYRLGAMGYLSGPGLDAESADGQSSGNYGDLDKIQALRWVRQNIAAFGGDPRNVTIAGQSAGAGSVCYLMASPPAEGLFHRAVIQSIGDCREISHEEGAKRGATFAAALGCAEAQDVTACLRGKSPGEIIDAQIKSATSWKPVVGGSAQPVSLKEAFASGDFARVPVIIGNTRNESRAFVYEGNDLVNQPLTAAKYEAQIRSTYGATADRVLAEYPLSAYDSPSLASGAVATDANFACPSVPIADSLSQWVPTFAYEFQDETAPLRPFMVIPPSFNVGSAHTSDVPYVWQSTTATALTAAQRRLATVMTNYWSAFARAGAPRVASQAVWPRYDTDRQLRLTLQAGGRTGILSGERYSAEHHCSFWSSLG